MSTFKLSEKDRQDIIDHFSSKIKDLEKEILHYQNLLNKIKYPSDDIVSSSSFEDKISDVVSSIKGYELEPLQDKAPVPRQNWKELCLENLREINAFSSTNDIYDYLIQKNPQYIKYDKVDAVSKISTALSNLYSKKEIKRIKNPVGRGYYWSLPVWFQPELMGYYKKRFCAKYNLNEEELNLNVKK